VHLQQLTEVVARRRTSMLVRRDQQVPFELIHDLCALAQWAPNHKRTWPWRFAAIEGDGRARLGDVIAEAMDAHDDPPDKVRAARSKYLRTPAVLVVGSAPGDSPLRTCENRDSVAAGVQNVLLGATAAGLASYWGSCPAHANDAVAELCGFDADTHIVAIIYLGWASSSVEAPRRPEPTITRISA
jgi:nitroreductase